MVITIALINEQYAPILPIRAYVINKWILRKNVMRPEFQGLFHYF